MWIVRLALRRPYTFVVMALMLLLAGIWVVRQTPTDVLPDVDIPVISQVLAPLEGYIKRLRARDAAPEPAGLAVLALGIVGGTLRVHPTAKLALSIAQVASADDLAMLAAAAGLASNLAALRALASEGISRGHMSLHARSVAVAAGAVGDEVEHVARAISEQTSITLQTAQAVLRRLRDV